MGFYTRIITFLLLASFAFSAACEIQFVDQVNVRVFNENYIAVKDAVASVTYQLDKTTAKGHYTAMKITDENGRANFTLINLERLEQNLDCKIDINVVFDTQNVTKTITAQSHPSNIDFVIKAHILTIRVLDQNSRPIEGAEVFVQNRTAITDKLGRASFIVGEGKVNVLAKYDVGKIEQEIEVKKQLQYDIGFAFYPLKITILDDNGKKLFADVKVGEESYEADGILELSKIARAKPAVTVTYGNVQKQIKVDLAAQTEYGVVYDLHAPRLGGITAQKTDKQIRLIMDIIDDGNHASGVNPQSIVFTYHYDTDEWSRGSAFAITQNSYGLELPIKKGAAILFFSVEVKDKEGNKAIFEGKIPVSEYTKQEINQTVTTKKDEEKPKDELPLPAIIGLAVVALIIYIIYRFKLSKGGEEQ